MESLTHSLAARVATAQVADLDSSWHGAAYRDGFSRLYVPEAGSGVVNHSDETFVLAPGWMYYIPAYAVQDYRCPATMTLHYVHFSLDAFGGVEVEPLLRCRYQIAPPDTHLNLFLDWCRHLESENDRAAAGDPAAQLDQKGTLLQLFSRFVMGVRDGENDTTKAWALRFRPVFAYIDTHLDDSLRVSRLAELMDLDRSYFSRQFKRIFGVPPERYVLRRKIQEAAGLLRQGEVSLQDIAVSLGFSDAFHFSKTFRKYTGLSPSEFRRSKIGGP